MKTELFWGMDIVRKLGCFLFRGGRTTKNNHSFCARVCSLPMFGYCAISPKKMKMFWIYRIGYTNIPRLFTHNDFFLTKIRQLNRSSFKNYSQGSNANFIKLCYTHIHSCLVAKNHQKKSSR